LHEAALSKPQNLIVSQVVTAFKGQYSEAANDGIMSTIVRACIIVGLPFAAERFEEKHYQAIAFR